MCNCCWLTVCIAVLVLCVLLSYVYLLYYVCIAVFLSLDARLLARSQYSEGPANGLPRHRFFLVSPCLKTILFFYQRDGQRTYNVTVRRVLVTVILRILSVYL